MPSQRKAIPNRNPNRKREKIQTAESSKMIAMPYTNCATCGKLFHKRRAIRKYCSRACSYAQNGRTAGKRSGIWRDCEYCTKKFYAYPYEHERARYCSNKCRARGIFGWTESTRPSNKRYITSSGGHEHRLVAEKMYGRKFGRFEHVHHINGDRTDNRPANLVLLSASAHIRLEWVLRKMRCAGRRHVHS